MTSGAAPDMHELSRAIGHASYAITDKAYAHFRPRDFAHISTGGVVPPISKLSPMSRAAG